MIETGKSSDNLAEVPERLAEEIDLLESEQEMDRRTFLKLSGWGLSVLGLSSVVSGAWGNFLASSQGTSDIDADTIDGQHASELGAMNRTGDSSPSYPYLALESGYLYVGTFSKKNNAINYEKKFTRKDFWDEKVKASETGTVYGMTHGLILTRCKKTTLTTRFGGTDKVYKNTVYYTLESLYEYKYTATGGSQQQCLQYFEHFEGNANISLDSGSYARVQGRVEYGDFETVYATWRYSFPNLNGTKTSLTNNF